MKILIIDDEKTQREILSDILADAGYEITQAADGEKGLEMIRSGSFALVLTDLKMPGKDGVDVLKETLDYNSDIQVVLMTAFGTIPSAVNAIKSGAYDYLTKPFQKEDLLRIIHRAADKARLLLENRRLQSEVEHRYSYHNIIGASPPMRKVFHLIDKIKEVDATVLIYGESGTGKELVAKAIHYSGRRKENPFVAVNCGAIPETLIESELFGHEKGAFTGASKTYLGKFEQAQHGTIFLDEIGVMPMHLQSRLLRVLQDKKIEKIGGSGLVDLKVRVIAATNEQLPEKVRLNEFRMDLYHRLNVFTIELPSLRERKQDIPVLARHFLQRFSSVYKKNMQRFSPGAIQELERYDYPGNVRELENIIEKTVILTDEEVITEDALMMPAADKNNNFDGASLAGNKLPDLEREMIVNALREHKGSIKLAAEMLGLTYKTLQYRIKKFGLDKNDYK